VPTVGAAKETIQTVGVSNVELISNTPNANLPFTALIIAASNNYYVASRRYLTFIDVFSYIGGLFPAIFALFFFMKYFGEYLFQVSFAHYLFQARETEDRNFLEYLKTMTYSFLANLGLKL
jgi:hypothetical protein